MATNSSGDISSIDETHDAALHESNEYKPYYYPAISEFYFPRSGNKQQDKIRTGKLLQIYQLG